MTTSRQGKTQQVTNQKITVSIIYSLCHGLSQRTNHLQRDFTSQLRLTGASERSISAARNLGLTTTSRTGLRDATQNSDNNHAKVNAAISEALEKGHLIVCIIDDYHHYHAIRRPNSSVTSSGADMCTTVIRIFPSIPAIPHTSPDDLHNPDGVNVTRLQETVCSEQSMEQLSGMFANNMPNWLTSAFFDPDMERKRLETHMYQQSDDVRTMRSMENLHLLDFIELPLKGVTGFQAAIENLLNTKLADYMKKYIVPIPGDWPAQFFTRKIIYSKLYKDRQMCTQSSVNTSDPLLSLVPILGPLHISLNAIEDVFINFRSFFAEIYSKLFPLKKPLPEKPKPW